MCSASLLLAKKKSQAEKWASALVSNMSTCEHANEGKHDIDRRCWPFTNARQAAGVAIGAFITADWPGNLIT